MTTLASRTIGMNLERGHFFPLLFRNHFPYGGQETFFVPCYIKTPRFAGKYALNSATSQRSVYYIIYIHYPHWNVRIWFHFIAETYFLEIVVRQFFHAAFQSSLKTLFYRLIKTPWLNLQWMPTTCWILVDKHTTSIAHFSLNSVNSTANLLSFRLKIVLIWTPHYSSSHLYACCNSFGSH